MDIQKIYAKNAREGINKVKVLLGDDAIILGTRRHRKGVELLVTSEAASAKLEPFFDNKHQRASKSSSITQLAENAAKDFSRYTHQAELLTEKHPATAFTHSYREPHFDNHKIRHAPAPQSAPQATHLAPVAATTQASLQQQQQTLGEVKHGLTGIKQLLAAQHKKAQVMQARSQQTDQHILALHKELKSMQKEIDKQSKSSIRAQLPMVKSLKKDILHLRQSISQQQTPVMQRVSHDISKLKDNLQNQFEIAGWNRWLAANPTRSNVLARLAKIGLHKTVAEKLIANLKETDDKVVAWRQVLGYWAKEMAVTHDNIINNGGRIALVGPTGVGKTTTIAKLASKFITRHGENSVALISYDHYRIGAHDQLMTYGRLIGAPVITAVNRAELNEIMNSLHHKKLVLIDTAGMSPNNPGFKDHLHTLQNTSINDQIDHYLTISANTQYSVLNKVIENYAPLNIKATILTKTDEATELGDVLSATLQQRLPIAYITTGQTVPSDIAAAKVTHLISQSISLANQVAKQAAKKPAKQGHQKTVASSYGPLANQLPINMQIA